jgi:hypothetical protein
MQQKWQDKARLMYREGATLEAICEALGQQLHRVKVATVNIRPMPSAVQVRDIAGVPVRTYQVASGFKSGRGGAEVPCFVTLPFVSILGGYHE